MGFLLRKKIELAQLYQPTMDLQNLFLDVADEIERLEKKIESLNLQVQQIEHDRGNA